MIISNNNWSVKTFVRKIEKGEIKFDNPVQRSFVWEPERKSDLIDTAMRGFPVPPLYAEIIKTEDGKNLYDTLDGQQRLTTLIQYLHDEFALTGVKPFVLNGEYYDVDGKKFSELPEELQAEIENKGLLIYYVQDATDEEIAELFRKLNNGRPLTAKQKNVAYCKDLKHVMEFSTHPFFADVLTEKKIADKHYVGIMGKIWLMLYEYGKEENGVSFEGKKLNKFLQELVITEEQEKEISVILDYLLIVLDNIDDPDLYKKLKTEIHYVSFVRFVKEAIDKELEPEDFAKFIEAFFSSDGVEHEAYEKACSGGTGKPASITTRDFAIKTEWDKYFEGRENTQE